MAKKKTPVKKVDKTEEFNSELLTETPKNTGIMAKTEIQEAIKGPAPKIELSPMLGGPEVSVKELNKVIDTLADKFEDLPKDAQEQLSEAFSESAPQLVQQIPASTEELVLEKNIQEPNPDEKLTQPVLLSNEELTDAYMQQSMLNQQLIEKQYIIEWKVFGQEYKGKYIYLQIDKEMFIFGTSVSDVGYIPAKDVKEAYGKFTAKD
jgi:hypothetical protein